MFAKIKKIVKNPYFFSVISKMFGVLIGFIFTIFQARYLGAEIKGQVTTVTSMVGITGIVCGLGIYLAYPYFKRNSDKDILPVFLKIGVGLLVIYSIISAVLILSLDLEPKYIAVLILNPLITYDGIISYLTLIESPNKRNATDMAVMFMELVVLVVLWIFAPPTFFLGVFVITIKDIVKAMIFSFWWRKKFFVKTEGFKEQILPIVKFGLFPMLSLLMNTLNYRVDVLMLDGRVEDSEIGVYSIGVLFAERVWLATDAMKGVMVSNITKGKDAAETAYIIRICNTLCLIMILGIVVLGKPFISIVFGEEFEGSYFITLIILLGVFPMNYYKMIDGYNVAVGKQKASFVMLTIGVLCNVIANIFLIPAFGIYGAGFASVISYTLCSTMFIVYFCRTTKLPFSKMLFVGKGEFKKLKELIKSKEKT